MPEQVEDFLEHFGVKGMKWGVKKVGGAAASRGIGQTSSVKLPNGDSLVTGKGPAAKQHAAKLQRKVDATESAIKTGVADKKVLSRKEVRNLNKMAEQDFYAGKARKIALEATKGDDVIIATRLPMDHAVTLAGGKQFLDHMVAGGAFDVKYTEVAFRKNQKTGDYDQNTNMIGSYQKIRRA